jgi:protein-L-isoaspartate(D-aspartate) O-methyltransferase
MAARADNVCFPTPVLTGSGSRVNLSLYQAPLATLLMLCYIIPADELIETYLFENILMNFEQARSNMIEQQIKPWDVPNQAVLDLISENHREDFIPDEYKRLALADTRIPLAQGQVTMTPKVEARLLQALEISPGDEILEVGTGCAYLTALLAKSGHHVLSVDIHPEFTEQAKLNLQQHHIHNVTLESGNAILGWERSSPYDVIVLTGSVPFLEQCIQQQLKIGGRLFAIIGQSPVMEARLIKRISENDWHDEILFETDLPQLEGAAQTETFKF